MPATAAATSDYGWEDDLDEEVDADDWAALEASSVELHLAHSAWMGREPDPLRLTGAACSIPPCPPMGSTRRQ